MLLRQVILSVVYHKAPFLAPCFFAKAHLFLCFSTQIYPLTETKPKVAQIMLTVANCEILAEKTFVCS